MDYGGKYTPGRGKVLEHGSKTSLHQLLRIKAGNIEKDTHHLLGKNVRMTSYFLPQMLSSRSQDPRRNKAMLC